MKHKSTKVITLGSTAFRQWGAKSHCKFIHGYNLKCKFYFSSKDNKLDDNNWIVDFGGLKELKARLKDMFDHKFWICHLDPFRTEFENLHKEGVLDLRVSEEGISIELFAKKCLEQANIFLNQLNEKEGRERYVLCYKTEVFEHEENSAICNL